MITIRFHKYGRLLAPKTFASVAAARTAFEVWRDGVYARTGKGASVVGGAILYREDGTPIARLSYNGRIWDPTDDTANVRELSWSEVEQLAEVKK